MEETNGNDVTLEMDEQSEDGDDVLPRMPGESHREWMERTDALMKHGDLTQPEAMVAVSMIWRNMHLLGCSYIEKAEAFIKDWDAPPASKLCSGTQKTKEFNIKDAIAEIDEAIFTVEKETSKKVTSKKVISKKVISKKVILRKVISTKVTSIKETSKKEVSKKETPKKIVKLGNFRSSFVKGESLKSSSISLRTPLRSVKLISLKPKQTKQKMFGNIDTKAKQRIVQILSGKAPIKKTSILKQKGIKSHIEGKEIKLIAKEKETKLISKKKKTELIPKEKEKNILSEKKEAKLSKEKKVKLISKEKTTTSISKEKKEKNIIKNTNSITKKIESSKEKKITSSSKEEGIKSITKEKTKTLLSKQNKSSKEKISKVAKIPKSTKVRRMTYMHLATCDKCDGAADAGDLSWSSIENGLICQSCQEEENNENGEVAEKETTKKETTKVKKRSALGGRLECCDRCGDNTEEDLVWTDNQLVCPKCEEELKKVDDVDNSVMMFCEECGSSSQELQWKYNRMLCQTCARMPAAYLEEDSWSEHHNSMTKRQRFTYNSGTSLRYNRSRY